MSYYDTKAAILTAQEQRVALERSRAAKARERELVKQEKQALTDAYHEEIKFRGLMLGQKVFSPCGLGVIRSFNEKKRTVAVLREVTNGLKAYKAEQLTPSVE